jgi:hypothetical protein
LVAFVLGLSWLAPPAARAQRAGEAQAQGGRGQSAGELAHAAQNPISSMVSFPFQLNFNGDLGAFHRTQLVLNIQPVIPIGVSDDVTLVTRWILPFVAAPDVATASGSTWGFGDFNPEWFLAFKLPAGFMIGPGFTAVAPTATDAQLGLGKWQLGPALVLVWSCGPVLAGVLATSAFSVGGDDRRPNVSPFLLQPFVNVNLPEGTYLTTAPQITNNWKLDRDGWTVPIGLGVGKILALGPQPANVSVQGYANVVSPDAGPEWTVRAQIQLLFPVKPKPKS